MNLPRDVDDYFKQTLDDTLGIPVSSRTLESKLQASQESQWRLREHLLSLFPQLKRKDQLIDRFKVSRLFKIFLSQFLFLILEVDVEIFGYGFFFSEQYEAGMNARALKKFVEENQRLATDCEKLLARCHQLENDRALYDKDREALMEFGNDADERAREAQTRVLDLERDLLFMGNELNKYKNQHQLVKPYFFPFLIFVSVFPPFLTIKIYVLASNIIGGL